MPALRPMPSGEVGRGAAQNQRRPANLRQMLGGGARVIMRLAHPRRLFVTGVMLLVQHNQAEIPHGREQRRARPDDHGQLAGAGSAPGVIALAGGQAAMHERGAARKALGDAADRLRRQRDLGHEQDGALALLQCFGDGAQVNFGFAAAGNAVQQETRRFFMPQSRPNGIPCRLLIGRQHGRAIGHKVEVAQGIAEDLFFAQLQSAELDQPVDSGAAGAGRAHGFGHGRRRGQFEQLAQQLGLLGRPARFRRVCRDAAAAEVGVEALHSLGARGRRRQHRLRRDHASRLQLLQRPLDRLLGEGALELREAFFALVAQVIQEAARQRLRSPGLSAGQGQLLRLIGLQLIAQKAIEPVGFAAEARRQHQPDAGANRGEAALAQPLRQRKLPRRKRRRGIQQLDDRLGFGDVAFVMQGEHDGRLHGHAELDADQRAGLQQAPQLVGDVVGVGLAQRHVQRDFGVAHGDSPQGYFCRGKPWRAHITTEAQK